MTHFIGLDIGGTKIAGAVLSAEGGQEAFCRVSTPKDYGEFLNACIHVIETLEKESGRKCSVGVSVAGAIDEASGVVTSANLALNGKVFRDDLAALAARPIRVANDANCFALSEYVDGAGAGCSSVLGLILGTGVASGFIIGGKFLTGANGLCGEIGHLPLPFRAPEDGVPELCFCRQYCIEKAISGSALERLYHFMTGTEKDAPSIADAARKEEASAIRVLDRYYEIVAKAMIAALYSFDPEVIVVGGGLCGLPGLYEEVPKRWGKYAVTPEIKTKFLPAKHGPESGLRGAAWLWQ